jgi:hypothetical protein
MARIRTVKPELFTSETLAQVSVEAERSFTGLLTQADDQGRLRESPAMLNGALWPCRPEHTVADMRSDIDALVQVGLLCRYTAADKKYLHFPTWNEHQKISHPSTRGLLPVCPIHDDRGGAPHTPSGTSPNSPETTPEPALSGKFPEPSGKTPQGKERKGKGKERNLPPLVNRGGAGGGIATEQRTATPPATAADAASLSQAKDSTNDKPTRTRRKGNTPPANTSPQDKHDDTEDDMGIYDTPVAPFTDLRTSGTVTRGRRKIGKNGVDPKYLASVERVIEHFTNAHQAIGTKFRVTDGWYTDTQAMLHGTEAVEPFTADQLCDLIDFGVHHSFWHAHLTNPAGLRKHSPKLYGSDDYIAWSLQNHRPEANRPRNTLVKGTADAPARPVRGQLAADTKRTAEDYRKPL